MRNRVWCVLVLVAFQHEGLAQHAVHPGVGLFGDPNGSYIEVSARPSGASVHVHLDKDGPEAPTFGGSWPADGWTRLDIIELNAVNGRPVRHIFSPYKTADTIPFPKPGSSMMLPPSDEGQFLSTPTVWGSRLCENDEGELEYETCSGDYFLTYDVVSVPAPLAGDANFDQAVGFADFLLLSENYGHSFARWDDGDFDLNGDVGMADFLLLAEHFGEERMIPTTALIPEPSANVWVAIVLLLGCWRWSRNSRLLAI